MKPELFNELWKIRNQIAHGTELSDTALPGRLAELGLSIATEDLPRLMPLILRAFRK